MLGSPESCASVLGFYGYTVRPSTKSFSDTAKERGVPYRAYLRLLEQHEHTITSGAQCMLPKWVSPLHQLEG